MSKKVNQFKVKVTVWFVCLWGLLCVSGCATGMHGNFIANTYIDPTVEVTHERLGEVTGTSSQTFFLYLFPVGDSPSTHQALANAKEKIQGTVYLSDVSIEDRQIWSLGFKKLVIDVDADARR